MQVPDINHWKLFIFYLSLILNKKQKINCRFVQKLNDWVYPIYLFCQQFKDLYVVAN